MIFILQESIMNGTVTMNTIVTGVEADSFKDAINKIKKLDGFTGAKIQYETNEKFSYTLDGQFPVYGNMDNKKLKII